MNNKDRKFIVNSCLDEIDACYDKIESGKVSKDAQGKFMGWVRKQREILKEVKYRGKMRRLKKGFK